MPGHWTVQVFDAGRAADGGNRPASARRGEALAGRRERDVARKAVVESGATVKSPQRWSRCRRRW